jgi:ribosomal protein S18 acetylase RimI-like enzyme
MSATGLNLRAFEPDDLPTLQQVRAAAFAPIFDSFRKHVGPAIAAIALAQSEAEQARLLGTCCSAGSGQAILVATLDGRIVGFVVYSVDAERKLGEIGLNAVDPDHAGRGIGTAMYDHVLAAMRALGAEAVEVGTGGDPSHAPARRAYEKAGFGPSIPSVTMYRLL